MLTGGDGLEHQILRNAITANQLNHDINLRISNHCTGITNDLCAITNELFGALHIKIGDRMNTDAAAGTAQNLILIAFEDRENAPTNSSNT